MTTTEKENKKDYKEINASWLRLLRISLGRLRSVKTPFLVKKVEFKFAKKIIQELLEEPNQNALNGNVEHWKEFRSLRKQYKLLTAE